MDGFVAAPVKQAIALSPVGPAGVTKPLPPTDGAKAITGTEAELRAATAADIAAAKAHFERLRAMPQPRDARAALQAYDSATAALSNASSRASVCNATHPDQAMREAANECRLAISAVRVELSLDRQIYEAISELDVSNESPATQYLAKQVVSGFRRSGISLDEAGRAEVIRLSQRLVEVGQAFDQNLRDAERTFQVPANALEGLGKAFLKRNPPDEQGMITLRTGTNDANQLIWYAKDSETRKAAWLASRQRGYPENLEVLHQLLETRHALATLLGFRNWAHYATETKMIGSEHAAESFIDDMSNELAPRGKEQYAAMLELKKQEDPEATQVHSWDRAYLSTKMRPQGGGPPLSSLTPYFEYSQVRQGIMDTTSRLFGVSFQKVASAKTWHPDVEVFDVMDGDRKLGRIHLDMFPREGKYHHFAMFPLVQGKALERLPECALVCNFPKSSEGPTLLTHGNVVTYFHEFGHLLHQILGGQTEWTAHAGTSTEWDFVEVPSKLYEFWAWDKEVVKSFARHHQTGEVIPDELLAALDAEDGPTAALNKQESVLYSATSLGLHNRDPDGMDSSKVIAELRKKHTEFEPTEGDYFQASFGHLHGYSATYYTYDWSAKIAASFMKRWKKKGLMDQEIAARYRRAVLEKGGSAPAAKLAEDFLGRPYVYEA